MASSSHVDETLTTMELYSKYKGFVYGVINKFYGTSSISLQEDLMSGGNIELWKGILNYVRDPKGSASSYLYKCVLNGVTNEFSKVYGKPKSAKREGVCSSYSLDRNMTDEEGEARESLGDLLPSNRTDWSMITDLIDVEIRVSKMNDRDKQIVRYLAQGYTHQEISNIFGVHRTYISKIVRKIRSVLRR